MAPSVSLSRLDEVRSRLSAEARVLVITGAGISAESGVPTFRGAGGLYRGHDPMKLATPQAFARDPHLVWEWYDMRIATVEGAAPNAGHRALAALEDRVTGFLLLTQNVDGLHQQAGSRHVFELHGSIRQARGTKTGRLLPRREAEADPETGLPVMPGTGELLRPHVVWFGEMLPRAPFEALSAFLRQGAVDVCLVIGTTALLPYIGESARLAQRTGALVVEINPEPGEVAALADVVWPTTAGYALPLLLAAEG